MPDIFVVYEIGSTEDNPYANIKGEILFYVSSEEKAKRIVSELNEHLDFIKKSINKIFDKMQDWEKKNKYPSYDDFGKLKSLSRMKYDKDFNHNEDIYQKYGIATNEWLNKRKEFEYNFEKNKLKLTDEQIEEINQLQDRYFMVKSYEYQKIEQIVKKDIETKKNVHTEHCCEFHGCKYNEPDCPVATGKQKQSFPCEYCAE